MNVKVNTWVEAQEGTNENSYQDQTIGWWGGAIYVNISCHQCVRRFQHWWHENVESNQRFVALITRKRFDSYTLFILQHP